MQVYKQRRMEEEAAERRPHEYLTECTVGRVYLVAERGEVCEVGGAELGKKRLKWKQQSIQRHSTDWQEERERELTAYQCPRSTIIKSDA